MSGHGSPPGWMIALVAAIVVIFGVTMFFAAELSSRSDGVGQPVVGGIEALP